MNIVSRFIHVSLSNGGRLCLEQECTITCSYGIDIVLMYFFFTIYVFNNRRCALYSLAFRTSADLHCLL